MLLSISADHICRFRQFILEKKTNQIGEFGRLTVAFTALREVVSTKFP